MNLLGSDSVLIDPTFDEIVRWQTNLLEYAHASDLLHDSYEYEDTESGR
jgi:hypothetical protein